MKKIMMFAFMSLTLLNFKTQAQEQNRAITTATPFLLIAADARSAGIGDQGVATSADAFSQQWNPAKYAFSSKQQGVGINYTPYLSNLVNDIFLGSVNYYNRFGEGGRSAVAASFRYFSLGDIEFRQNANDEANIQKPNELTFDLSYALQLSPTLSMGIAGRYLRSDLRLQGLENDASAGTSFGVDVAAFYRSEEIAYSSFNGRWRAGVNISNIGPKLKYDDAGQESFIPTTFRAGVGFDFLLDEYNRITPSLEFAKLLVPTPLDPDADGDGVITAEEQNNANEEYEDISAFGAVFSSWGDAPDGFSEELKEFTWSLGAEYVYKDVFSFRGGYFNEAEEKGARKFITLGAGFKYTIVNLDISYLFSTSAVRSPLEGTLRFGLSFNFGEDYYDR